MQIMQGRRSTTEYYNFLGENLMTWKAKHKI